MAWQNFWTLDDQGRRVTSAAQLALFRSNFPERVVEPKREISRPLMLILDKPYRLTRLPGAELYEHHPLRLRDLHGWPPSLSLSRFGHFPRPGDGDLVDAKVIPPTKKGEVHLLLIRGDFEDQEGGCTIVGYPAALLDCIAITLNGHRGEPFRSLSGLELCGPE